MKPKKYKERWTVQKDERGIGVVRYPIYNNERVVVMGLRYDHAKAIVDAHNEDIGCR